MKGLSILIGVICLVIALTFSVEARAIVVEEDCQEGYEVSETFTETDIPAPISLPPLQFNAITRATVTITGPDGDDDVIFDEEFRRSGNCISISCYIWFPAPGEYHVREQYFLEAAPSLLPHFVVFSADPVFEWDVYIDDPGCYTLSLDARWDEDSRAEVSGDIETDPSPVTLGYILDGECVVISFPNGLVQEVTVEFQGWIDKMTTIECEEECEPEPDHRPVIFNVEPDRGVRGETLDVRITGQNFSGVCDPSQVSFGDDVVVNSLVFVNPGTLFVNIEIPLDAEIGWHDVTVINGDGCPGTAEDIFKVEALKINQVIPSVGAPGTTIDVTITGMGFKDCAEVLIGDIVVNDVCYISPTQLVANITIPPDTWPGYRDLSVINPDSNSDTLENGFRVSTPTLLSILNAECEEEVCASEGERLELGIYLETGENVNGIAAYLNYDPEVIRVIPYNKKKPFRSEGFFGEGSRVMENQIPEDGMLNYAEGNACDGVDPEGFVATFLIEVLCTPESGVTEIKFDLDRSSGRMTELALCEDGTFIPLTKGFRIRVISPSEMFISGKVLLQSRIDHTACVTFEIRQDGRILKKLQVYTEEDGTYHLNDLNLSPGESYDVTAKAPGFLKGKVECVTLPAINVDFSLLGGDVDGDNDVDLADFNRLAMGFGRVYGDRRYNSSCDFNGNGFVDLPDFAVLASNFGEAGAPSPNLISDGKLELEAISKAPRLGDTLELSLRAVDVQALYAYAFQLSYDPSQLRFVGADEGEIFKASGPSILHVKPEKPGLVTVLGSLIGANDGVIGEGELMKLRFKLLANSGELTLNDPAMITVVGLQDGALVKLPSQSLTLNAIPNETTLGQNYPNPFNPETWIPFALSKPSDVMIRIFDSSGRLIRTIDLGRREAGFYMDRGKAAYWDGRNELGEKVSSGVYFYQIQTKGFTAMRRMVILK